MSTVQNPGKVVAIQGIKQAGCATSAEHGTLVTMIAAISATGKFVPPMFVYPRVNFLDRMLYSSPPGSIGAVYPSGWSNEEIFMKFLQHFIKHVKPCKEQHVLLIIDNYETHLNIEALDIASNSGIVIVKFPSHTLHKIQPLDLFV